MPDDTFEQWRKIPGLDGYEISNRGRVRSWKHWSAPEPRVLKIQIRNGVPRIRLTPTGKEHIIDDLMQAAWGTPSCIMRWRRLMLSEREHGELLGLLTALQSDAAKRLVVRLRTAKRVAWYDPIAPDELGQEVPPCAD